MGNECALFVYTHNNEEELILSLNSFVEYNETVDIVLVFNQEFTENFKNFIDSIQSEKLHLTHTETDTDTEAELVAAALTMFSIHKFSRCVYVKAGMVFNGDVSNCFSVDMKDAIIAGVNDLHMYQHEHIKNAYDIYDIDNVSEKITISNEYLNAGLVLIDVNTFAEINRHACGIHKMFLDYADYGYEISDEFFLNIVFRYYKKMGMPHSHNHLTDFSLSEFMSFGAAINNSIDGTGSFGLNFCGIASPMKKQTLNIKTMRLPMDVYIREFEKVREYMSEGVQKNVDVLADKYLTLVLPIRKALKVFRKRGSKK